MIYLDLATVCVSPSQVYNLVIGTSKPIVLNKVGNSLTCQTFHSAKGEEKSGNLPIPFWFAEFGIILRQVNGMLILCCHVQCPCMCTCRFW